MIKKPKSSENEGTNNHENESIYHKSDIEYLKLAALKNDSLKKDYLFFEGFTKRIPVNIAFIPTCRITSPSTGEELKEPAPYRDTG